MQTEDLLPMSLLSYKANELKKKKKKRWNLTHILHTRLASNRTESRDPCGSASVKIPHSAPGQVVLSPAVMQQNAKQQRQLQVQQSCSTSGGQRGAAGQRSCNGEEIKGKMC